MIGMSVESAWVLLAASSGVLSWTWFIIQAALGLGFVIFVHELGHFLVAKACGVQCDKFYVGFDVGGYKLSRQWGETEYGIGILPLGGYVKMLGQDDNPANAAREMERAKQEVAADDGDSAGDAYELNPRSYLAKSVPQRMAIISAGVVMNMIFAFIFAVVAYSMGVNYLPCVVSEVVPGSPAWRANIQVGDEIVKIDDIRKPRFRDLKTNITLGDMENGVPIEIHRPGQQDLISMAIKPEQRTGLATVGIISPRSLRLAKSIPPAIANSPAALAEPAFESGDLLVAADGQPLKSYRDLIGLLAAQPDQPIEFQVERDGAETTTRVEPKPMKRLGLVMLTGKITAVQSDSPAAKAGLEPGDFIELVDGEPIQDPVTFPERLRRLAVAGEPVTLTIRREGKEGASQQHDFTIELRPVAWTENSMAGTPLSVPALGIAYHVLNRVHAVVPGSPAAEAGITAKDVVTKARFLPAKDDESKMAQLLAKSEIEFGEAHPNWPALMNNLQWLPEGCQVELTVESSTKQRTVKLVPRDAPGWFVPERGFQLEPVTALRQAEGVGEAIGFAWQETKNALMMVFQFLQKLGTQIPLTALGGPVTIAQAAGLSAAQGVPELLLFLTVLSANLAVVNFLPIPVLDGGHMVFLLYEGIMRRPVSEKVVIALQTVGFLFIVGLMLFVLALDVGLIPRGL